MKYLIFFILFLTQLGTIAYAQSGCPIDCCTESFPYVFCPKDTGTDGLHCSAIPNSDPSLSGKTPVKVHIPGKVCVDQLPLDETLMPITDGDNLSLPDPMYAPTDPREIQFNNDDSLILISQEPIDFDPSNTLSHGQWVTDHTSWQNAIDTSYKKIWDLTQADTDAQNALDHWVALCPSLVKDTTCCLHITYATDDPKDQAKRAKFQNQHLTSYLAVTDAPICGESGCSTDRSVIINCTDEGRFKILFLDSAIRDVRFNIIQVPQVAFWTGRTHPTGIVNQEDGNVHELYSWYQLMEHEIGHFLGMQHPEQISNGDTCRNNVTQCSGHQMMMQDVINPPNTNPVGLFADDTCEFRKLYCFSSLGCSGGVNDTRPTEPYNMQIFPNPSTGVTLLSYSVPTNTSVKICLYDLLGKVIINVVDEKESQGQYTISLPTQYLAAGHYVCHVQVGEHEANGNIVIYKVGKEKKIYVT